MRTDLDHLPAAKQRELERVVQILFEEFDEARVLATQDWKKKGRILKIVLYGSYARGGWVDEPHTAKGYQSDFDLLFIVHSLHEVNDGLAHGRFFFMDVARDGIAIYQSDDSELAEPKPKTAKQALAMAREYYDEWMPGGAQFLETAQFAIARHWNKKAAFLLHQAKIERA